MDLLQRRLLGWLGVAVGLSAASVTAAWVWLTRFERPPHDIRPIAACLGLLALLMALRCGRASRAA